MRLRIYGGTNCLGRALQGLLLHMPAAVCWVHTNPAPRKGVPGKGARQPVVHCPCFNPPALAAAARPGPQPEVNRSSNSSSSSAAGTLQQDMGRRHGFCWAARKRSMRLRAPPPPRCATWQLRVGLGQQQTCLGEGNGQAC